MTTTIGSNGQELGLRISRGHDFGPHTVELTQDDGSALSLVGCSLLIEIKRTPDQTGNSATFTYEVSSPASAGIYTFSMTRAEVAKLTAPLYVWRTTLVDGAGRRIPVFTGPVVMEGWV